MKKNNLVVLVLMIFCIAPTTSFASSGKLICGVDTVTQCAYDIGCVRASAREVNLPRFIKVNIRRKSLEAVNVEPPRKTEAKHLEEMDNRFILQGAENGRAWSMVIRKGTGEMSATVSDDLMGFVVFGMCIED